MMRKYLQIAAVALFLAWSGGLWAASDAALEYEVKAAFLYNFAKFVEWPTAAFSDPDEALEFCILGDDPFGASIDRIVKGRAANGRAIAIRRNVRADASESCHLIFLGAMDDSEVARVVQDVGGAPVLTVGESPSFLDEGGIIGLVIDDGKVRFEINARGAEHAGLKVSSQLLKLARSVRK
jgi:hypothetical protein